MVRPLGKDGVRLFVERARAARDGWDPGVDTPVIEEICALLDDLPLGIELAAARIAMLPPGVIRDRHDRPPALARAQRPRCAGAPTHAGRGSGLEPRPARPSAPAPAA